MGKCCAALELEKGMSLAQRLIGCKQNYQIPGKPAPSHQEGQPYRRRIIVSSLFAELVLFFPEDFPFLFFDSLALLQFLETAVIPQRVTGEERRQLLCQADKVGV